MKKRTATLPPASPVGNLSADSPIPLVRASSEPEEEEDDYEYSCDEESDAAGDYVVDAPFTMLDQDHIYKLMDNTVTNAAGLLNLSWDEAYMLLVHYNWNDDRALEEFFADAAKVQ
jgi:hypothetical protein